MAEKSAADRQRERERENAELIEAGAVHQALIDAAEVAEKRALAAAERAERAVAALAEAQAQDKPLVLNSEGLAEAFAKAMESRQPAPTNLMSEGDWLARADARLEGKGSLSDPERLIDAESKEPMVVFRSRGANMLIMYQSPTQFQSPDGRWQTNQGFVIDFAPENTVKTNRPEIIDFLRGLRSFNREFVEVGNEPDRIPSPELVLDEILKCAVELDADRLVAIEAEEQAVHKREVVLAAVATARRQVAQATPVG